MITVDSNSQWRSGCSHWQGFSSHLQEWLTGRQAQLPETVLHFRTTDKAVPSDGKLHLLFGQTCWEVTGAFEDQEGYQRAQALVGNMYLRIWGLPDCPDDGDRRESDAVIVLLVKKIKGNGFVIVQIGRVPGKGLVEVALEEATVLAALEAAQLSVGVDEVVYVNDELATLGEYVEDGDVIVVRHPMPETTSFAVSPPPAAFAASEPPATGMVDFSTVPGTDATALRGDAERLLREAEELEAGARAALASAAEKRELAKANRAKAGEIESAHAAFNAAVEQLETLGVIRPKGEGRTTDLRRLFQV
jgi:hypothetical protein